MPQGALGRGGTRPCGCHVGNPSLTRFHYTQGGGKRQRGNQDKVYIPRARRPCCRFGWEMCSGRQQVQVTGVCGLGRPEWRPGGVRALQAAASSASGVGETPAGGLASGSSPSLCTPIRGRVRQRATPISRLGVGSGPGVQNLRMPADRWVSGGVASLRVGDLRLSTDGGGGDP